MPVCEAICGRTRSSRRCNAAKYHARLCFPNANVAVPHPGAAPAFTTVGADGTWAARDWYYHGWTTNDDNTSANGNGNVNSSTLTSAPAPGAVARAWDATATSVTAVAIFAPPDLFRADGSSGSGSGSGTWPACPQAVNQYKGASNIIDIVYRSAGSDYARRADNFTVNVVMSTGSHALPTPRTTSGDTGNTSDVVGDVVIAVSGAPMGEGPGAYKVLLYANVAAAEAAASSPSADADANLTATSAWRPFHATTFIGPLGTARCDSSYPLNPVPGNTSTAGGAPPAGEGAREQRLYARIPVSEWIGDLRRRIRRSSSGSDVSVAVNSVIAVVVRSEWVYPIIGSGDSDNTSSTAAGEPRLSSAPSFLTPPARQLVINTTLDPYRWSVATRYGNNDRWGTVYTACTDDIQVGGPQPAGTGAPVPPSSPSSTASDSSASPPSLPGADPLLFPYNILNVVPVLAIGSTATAPGDGGAAPLLIIHDR